jgi:uncharacterized membrane protein YedE/YeeE
MPFTPVEGLIGGLMIGISSAAHLYLHGKISGMSGKLGTTMKQIEKSFPSPATYLGGMIVAGALSQFILPTSSFSPLKTSIGSLLLYCIAGLFVGIGTQLANGCTSGHMICGLARFSKRSFVAVLVFCGVAFAVSKVFHSANFYQSAHEAKLLPSMQFPSFSYTLLLLVLLAAVVAVYYVLIEYHSQIEKTPAKQYLEFIDGFVFAFGLIISGMTNPLKVLGFFDVGGPHFDPTLVCVAIGATMFDMYLFNQFILKKSKPVYSPSFTLSNTSEITAPLIVGSALFGAGWGLAGVCPGPAIVNVATLSPSLILFHIMFGVGVFGRKYLSEKKIL